MTKTLLLKGLDGGNPLAFLAALGTGLVCRQFCPAIRISWVPADHSWRPLLHGDNGDEATFLADLHTHLLTTDNAPFEIDKKLPFSRDSLRAEMRRSQCNATLGSRRDVDILAGFGSDAHADKDDIFLDTRLRMLRSRDSAGQGLPFYAKAIRNGLTVDHLKASLFATWRYEDDTFSLRWDPLEDQRYALRWYDPRQQSNKKYGPRSMRGANALALEALALLPVQPRENGIATTGFTRLERRRDYFTWPIWESPAGIDVVRSLLTLSELSEPIPDRRTLLSMGIAEIYRCERVAPNQYYKNFTPAHPA